MGISDEGMLASGGDTSKTFEELAHRQSQLLKEIFCILGELAGSSEFTDIIRHLSQWLDNLGLCEFIASNLALRLFSPVGMTELVEEL